MVFKERAERISGVLGVVLTLGAGVGLVADRVRWAGIPSMAFADPIQTTYAITNLSVASVIVGGVGMLLVGFWAGSRLSRLAGEGAKADPSRPV
ncbi:MULTISPECIES: hypothetical protein [unclassified Microbacterium]|uniref:hypothetical protein n=1 Tax=unclassified Microbacterium TaxID=2609290 RepID=UPI0016052C1B|nr:MULTISPECIES: hypothetical protein [unclassified Microbacterium]QNA93726.1 hypothetical protein G4G29_18155 [Microbacterium sp. Se63.02b]QYM64018.1 hypothetical protein K1X59_18240 [Microbacterium sp. Se5.02b]